MKKRDKVTYWTATIWLSLGMVSTGIVQIIHLEEEVRKMNTLGYSSHFLTIIGIWKLIGVIAILVPKLPLLKEWAYAGFFFLMTGAIFTHLAAADNIATLFGPTLLLVLTIASWYYRPAGRKL